MTTRDALHEGAGGIAPDAVRDVYRQRGMQAWSDRHLIGAGAEVLAPPRFAPADSFVLHAPLELLARAGLLGYVRPAAREGARERIVWLAAQYEAAGDPVRAPAPATFASLRDAALALVDALARGELDDVDRIGFWLGTHATPLELRELLAEPVIPSLAAAGHAGILFWLFPRVAPGGDVTGAIIRGPLRELARQPEWQLRWFEQVDHADDVAASIELVDALLDVPILGVPGSTFIFPIMHQAESSGVAAQVLAAAVSGDIDVRESRRAIARVAAWSMLQEPPEHAPYGWTHCLTMPQAVMGLAGDGADPRTALAVAATYVVGFRSALGQHRLDPTAVPEPAPDGTLVEAIEAGPRDGRRRGLAHRRGRPRRRRDRAGDQGLAPPRRALREIHPRVPRRGGHGSRLPAPVSGRGGIACGLVGGAARRRVLRLIRVR